ncbi:MAG TPA: hypothetical protein VLG12_06455 [Candidatus Saccharimonadales bacterium]|nr:hypothetical protein [Candidatus Saccharimonadales bacterium]
MNKKNKQNIKLEKNNDLLDVIETSKQIITKWVRKDENEEDKSKSNNNPELKDDLVTLKHKYL